ncbi:MAG: cell shape-determining protein MreD [Bradymonadia bacterium]|jgi:cell shape-determining protein MreD
MVTALTILFGLFSIVLVSSAAPWLNTDSGLPRMVIILVVFRAANREFTSALLVALALGWVAGSMVGFGKGIELLSLLAVASVTYSFAGRLPLERSIVGGLWSLLAVGLHDVVFVLLSLFTANGLPAWRALLSETPESALSTGLLAMLILAALRRVEPLLRERQERSTVLR